MTASSPIHEAPIDIPLVVRRRQPTTDPVDSYDPVPRSSRANWTVSKPKIESPNLPGPQEAAAAAERDRQADALNAAEIEAEAAVARRRSQERVKAMWAALETECLQMWGEVMLARQKVMDELFDKWCKLILG